MGVCNMRLISRVSFLKSAMVLQCVLVDSDESGEPQANGPESFTGTAGTPRRG